MEPVEKKASNTHDYSHLFAILDDHIMKPFAIYFPQFYPTSTNDDAWGKGFTDWLLVERANEDEIWSKRKPLKGFYNGSSTQVHLEQIKEAVSGDLGGFAIYHYWFFDHQELDAFEKTLLSVPQESSIPWFLIWATESWSKRWAGDPTTILNLSSNPNDSEIRSHCHYLVRCFGDPNYFCWNNKPLFVFYNLAHFDNAEKTLSTYRATFKQLGFDVAFGHFIKSPADISFSNLVEVNYLFEPRLFFNMHRSMRGGISRRLLNAISSILGKSVALKFLVFADKFQQKGQTYSAKSFVQYIKSQQRSDFEHLLDGEVQEVFSPGWNNTPRYKNRFTALEDIEPEVFSGFLQQASKKSKLPTLINAWNEWSEGAAIEPCAYLGSRYLNRIKN